MEEVLSYEKLRNFDKVPEAKSMFFPFDETFKEKQEYLNYTFDIYNDIYNLDTIKYKCEVPEGLFKGIKEKLFFVLLVLYDNDGRIYLKRNIQEKLGWSLPGGSILNSEDVHSSLRRIAKKININFDNDVSIGEVAPIAFLENHFVNKDNAHSHKGIAFIARVRNKNNLNLDASSGDFIYLNNNDLEGVNKYANSGVVRLAMQRINKVIGISYENEISTNEKYKTRYLVHNLFMKKFILTPRVKRKGHFINLLKEKIGNARTFIDVSCGDSNLINKILGNDFLYAVANDISWSQLDLINNKNNRVIFTNHNAIQLPFKEEVFDVAYCGNTLHHMSNKYDLMNLLDNLYRVSKKVLIVEIERPRDSGFLPYILNRFWYRGFLKDIGGAYLSKDAFEDIISRHFNGRAEVIFSEFRNIQGRYLIAEISRKDNLKQMDNKNNILEAEAKFRCKNINKLKSLCQKYNFQKKDLIKEIDDYFTDKDKTFIKDRVCLRFRDKNGKKEFTYKGKSESDSNFFIKNEYNIQIDESEYKEKIRFLESLGFYKYVTVIKRREIYTKDDGHYTKNIMFDYVEGVGSFVEFEVVSENNNFKNKDSIKKELDGLIDSFGQLDLQKANLPYRDYVARNLNNV